ncbi:MULTISPECIES: hypothetical protein [Salinicola]|uniref:hypothetical protein n=1 Tax=Salinicola TaxID=404432 RepID=UPI0013A66356|nr:MULTISPECIES: hypothetical protein [Salinicola]
MYADTYDKEKRRSELGMLDRADDHQKDNDGSLAAMTGQHFLDRFPIWFVEAHYAVHPDPCGGRRFRG